MNTQTLEHNETKVERRQRRLQAHYDKCAALATTLGWKRTDGKKVSVALWKVEQIAHKGATAYCNGEPYTLASNRTFDFQRDGSGAWEMFTEHVARHIADILGTVPPGFFVNADARGYALKINNENQKGKKLIDSLRLHTDWGGYGILSPSIDGDA